MKQFKIPKGKTLVGIYDNLDKTPLKYFLNKCKFVDTIISEELFILKQNVITNNIYALSSSNAENNQLKSLKLNLYLVDNLRLEYLSSYYSVHFSAFQAGITNLFNIQSKYGNVITFTYRENFINNIFLKDYDNN